MKISWLRTEFLWLAVFACGAQAWGADTAPTARRRADTADPPPAAGAAERPSGGTAVRPPSAGPAERPTGPDVVTLNFVNADIEGVVKAVSEITGKNFVLDPRVKGTINIISAKPMSRALVYEVFLSALRLQGFTAIEERGRVEIVPEVDAKLHQTLGTGPRERPRAAGDVVQTQVFKLQYESAAQMVPVLRPLIAANNTITAYQNNNTLVITDYASNLARIEKIIESVDQPGSTEPIMIALQYASAVDVAQTINRLFAESAQAQASPDPSLRFSVTVDARSNSILARSGDPSRLLRVRQLVAMLDTPTSAAGNIHVVYLKNAEAVKLAEILRAIYTGESTAATTRASTPLSGGGATGGAAPLGQAPAPAPASSTAPGIIQADAATNSIIITAPDAVYNNLRAALERLDVRRAQVYVEGLIAEVSADKVAELGVQWQDLSAAGKDSAQAFGGTNFGAAGQNIIGISQNPGSAGHGLNIGIVKGTVTIPGIGAQILNIGLLVRALQTDTKTNILSTPTLLTLDNEEAKIVIGQNVPFVTGSYAVSAAATTPTPFQTVERHDVGLTLRIKPQISEGGAVRLQIYQEVSSIQDASSVTGIITNKRSIESTVLVDDTQIVVIGGLIQDQVNDNVEKIPGLGELPVIGTLFRYTTRSRNKTNLMVFLRPTLLRSAQGVTSLTNDRYDYILNEQLKVQTPGTGILDFGTPSLPPRQSAAPPGTETPAITAPK
jgi:general secretion pathway protein D